MLGSKQLVAATMVEGDTPGVEGVRVEKQECLIFVEALEFLGD